MEDKFFTALLREHDIALVQLRLIMEHPSNELALREANEKSTVTHERLGAYVLGLHSALVTCAEHV